MRDLFPDYYRPTAAEFKALWGTAQFGLDANVLLNLFRYSHETARNLLDVFKWLGPRVWVSHQAALEYHRNYASALWQESEGCRELLNKLPTGQSFTHARDLPILPATLVEDVRSVLERVKSELKQRQDRLLKSLSGDPMQDELASLLAGKVGPPFTPEEKTEAEKEGKARFDRKQPPGFADEKTKKEDPERLYGDWFVWSQTLRHCKESSTDLILVTGEKKEDWVLKAGERTLGPRPELVGEFRKVVGKRFHLYDVATFLTYAREHMKADVKDSSIKEAQALPPRPRGIVDVGWSELMRNRGSTEFPMARLMKQVEANEAIAARNSIFVVPHHPLGDLASAAGPLADLMKSMHYRMVRDASPSDDLEGKQIESIDPSDDGDDGGGEGSGKS